MNTENKRKETLLNILKTMEFDYIDTDKYNGIAENFFANSLIDSCLPVPDDFTSKAEILLFFEIRKSTS